MSKAEKKRETYNRRKAAGVCVICEDHRDNHTLTCTACLRQQRRWVKKYRETTPPVFSTFALSLWYDVDPAKVLDVIRRAGLKVRFCYRRSGSREKWHESVA